MRNDYLTPRCTFHAILDMSIPSPNAAKLLLVLNDDSAAPAAHHRIASPPSELNHSPQSRPEKASCINSCAEAPINSTPLTMSNHLFNPSTSTRGSTYREVRRGLHVQSRDRVVARRATVPSKIFVAYWFLDSLQPRDEDDLNPPRHLLLSPVGALPLLQRGVQGRL
jgi:hypothetical protein